MTAEYINMIYIDYMNFYTTVDNELKAISDGLKRPLSYSVKCYSSSHQKDEIFTTTKQPETPTEEFGLSTGGVVAIVLAVLVVLTVGGIFAWRRKNLIGFKGNNSNWFKW